MPILATQLQASNWPLTLDNVSALKVSFPQLNETLAAKMSKVNLVYTPALSGQIQETIELSSHISPTPTKQTVTRTVYVILEDEDPRAKLN